MLVGHRLDDLVALGLAHARVVGALADQQRPGDGGNPGQRRALGQQLLAGRGAGVAHAPGELLEERGPVGRDGGQQGIEVGGADDVHAALERVGGEGEPDQGGVATVAAAHDRDLLTRRHAVLHRPVHRVDQVVVHLAGPFAVTGIGEGLAEAGGAAVVDRQDRIAAVGQPLVVGVVAIDVARPRPAMHQQHHRHRRVGLAVAIGVGGARQGEVADQGQPVARADFLRPLRRQRLAFQRRARGEQFFRGAATGIAVIGDRRLGGGVGDDPGFIVEGARGDAEAARADGLERVQVRCDGRVDRLPLVLQVIDRHRLRAPGHRVVEGVVDVGACVLVDQRLRPRAGVDGIQRRGIAAA